MGRREEYGRHRCGLAGWATVRGPAPRAPIDDYWAKLLQGGGQPSQCGWLKDKFGLSWQVVPKVLGEMMQDKDAEKTNRVMEALLKMIKLDIAELKRAYEGAPIGQR